MTAEPPPDDDVRRALEDGLRSRGQPATVTRIDRAPYPYATSFPLEELTVRTSDGRVLHLILKDLTWERLLGDALHTKPRFLYEPRRSIETYRRTLAGSELGAVCYAAHADEDHGRYWLLIEKATGVELWQIGAFGTWEAVSRWLARFHRRFTAPAEELLEVNPYLLRYGAELFRTWPSRAVAAAAGTSRRALLEHVASRYGDVVDTLCAVPPTFVHGEFYPSNVLVDERGANGEVTVWPVDWEMAGVGPAYLDLAALTAGWDGDEQGRLVAAYLDELGPAGWRRDDEGLARVVDCCRLHLAVQWLGWSNGWAPPPEHARDWVAEVRDTAERLAL